jgi:hypothetical protein
VAPHFQETVALHVVVAHFSGNGAQNRDGFGAGF